MSGLNDNAYFLTDDSMEKPVNPIVTIKAFKDNQEGEDAPELRDDINLIAAATEELVITLRSADLFKQTLVLNRGISQSIALEARSLLPQLITDLQPVEFYTRQPSKTLLAAALEQAQELEGKTVIEFTKLLVDQYTRAAKWFTDFSQNDYDIDLNILGNFVITVDQFKEEDSLSKFNAAITKLPLVAKLLAHPEEVQAVLFSNEQLLSQFESVLTQIKDALIKKDLTEIARVAKSNTFNTLQTTLSQCAMANAQLKSLEATYSAKDVEQLIKDTQAADLVGKSAGVLKFIQAADRLASELAQNLTDIATAVGQLESTDVPSGPALESLSQLNQQATVPVAQQCAFSVNLAEQLTALGELVRTGNISSDDLYNVVALETTALDAVDALLKAKGPVRSHRLIAALEDDSSNTNNSSIMKVIENLLRFIEQVVDNLKKAFDSSKAKANEEVAKKYKGPTDSGIAKAFQQYAKEKAKDNPEVEEKLKTLSISYTAPLPEIEKKLQEATGEKISYSDRIRILRETRIQRVLESLSEPQVDGLNTILDKEFIDSFHKAMDSVDTIVNQRINTDNLKEHLNVWNGVLENVVSCGDLIAKNDLANERIVELILGNNSQISNAVIKYAETDVSVLYLSQYLKHVNTLVNTLNSANTDIVKEQLTDATQVLRDITRFVNLANRVSKSYNLACDIMRGM